MIVRKRDGRLEEFNEDKILESIKKAALAVEGKDEDIQKRAIEIQSIKRQLMQHGFDADEAEEQAESQFDGYLENGEYTEYDEDEANDVLNIVLASIDSLGLDEDDSLDTEVIQDIVEKALMITEHGKTAREYIIKRANRERIREMNTSLMKSFEDLTFGKSEDVETKRENANIDGDSAMGTMLKYGSEGAKKFNLLHVVPPEQSEAHSNGDIHIHDLDFLSLTETCLSAGSRVVIRNNKKQQLVEVEEYFKKYLDIVPVDTVVRLEGYEILSRGNFVKLINCVRHNSDTKCMLGLVTNFSRLEVTDNHVIPVIRGEKTLELEAKYIEVGDKLIIDTVDRVEGLATILNIQRLSYQGYVYDFETENHYFSANGFTVHNCCQIDLEKLFNGGFNTGHGFLREPGEIRSYAALACIAIQSNQNDMHSVF